MNIKIKTKFGKLLGLFCKDKEYDIEVPVSEATKKQMELMKDLRSDIRVRETKLGGSGICQKCKEYQSNLSFHEARCDNAPDTSRSIRG